MTPFSKSQPDRDSEDLERILCASEEVTPLPGSSKCDFQSFPCGGLDIGRDVDVRYKSSTLYLLMHSSSSITTSAGGLSQTPPTFLPLHHHNSKLEVWCTSKALIKFSSDSSSRRNMSNPQSHLAPRSKTSARRHKDSYVHSIMSHKDINLSIRFIARFKAVCCRQLQGCQRVLMQTLLIPKALKNLLHFFVTLVQLNHLLPSMHVL
jgi:hypothetical protein